MDGSLFAYAVGNDWHKGLDGAGQFPTKLCYRVCGDEAKPKQVLGSTMGTTSFK